MLLLHGEMCSLRMAACTLRMAAASPVLAKDVARLLACAWSCLAIASGKRICFCRNHGS